MKKYTIKDKSGTKKTIYAKDLVHALTFVDSKVKDDTNRPKTFKFFINNRAVSENEYIKSFIEEAANERQSATTAKRIINEDKESAKISGKNTFMFESGYKFSIIYDSVKDDVVSNYFYFDLDDLNMSLDNAVNIMKNCGLTIVKIDKRSKEAKVYYRGTSAAEQKAADKLDISLDDSINDSIKDEANLPTTIQALVNDEEAAIKAYEVAIKNLEGKIDETQMQVLVNIMKDERRHVENLYAILNGQVTEKNLEDSVNNSNYMTAGFEDYCKKTANDIINYAKKLDNKAVVIKNRFRKPSSGLVAGLELEIQTSEYKKLHKYISNNYDITEFDIMARSQVVKKNADGTGNVFYITTDYEAKH